jgi:hypothetical protein
VRGAWQSWGEASGWLKYAFKHFMPSDESRQRIMKEETKVYRVVKYLFPKRAEAPAGKTFCFLGF